MTTGNGDGLQALASPEEKIIDLDMRIIITIWIYPLMNSIDTYKN